ncbi:DUF3772 domain-containing protein [Pseudosulfitobacter sp. SM2401]|uniref:DUF3772 domain-containing protein n=1 Tax=Pseudosulfitobacter sp. SM2401 TaxID=3350098 RepID=UPI0036F41272
MKSIHQWLALLCLVCLPVLANAQTAATAAPNYDLWQSVAGRAETAVDTGTDSSEVFEVLRVRITDFRAKFAAARTANKERIQTLQAQLSALGPVPETGSEPANVATRRAELTKTLAEVQGPAQVAEAAYSRADGLIREIDNIIRERQTERLLALGPSPVNPVNWGPALTDFRERLSELSAESRLWSDPDARTTFRESTPLVLLLLAVAIVLLARGRRWSAIIADFLRRLGGRGLGVWGFVISLLRIALPLLGLLALCRALDATGMLGLRGQQLVDAIPYAGATLLGARWLAERLFSRLDEDALIMTRAERRSEARLYATLLALFLVLRGALDMMLSYGKNLSAATPAVLSFPLLVVTGLVLFRMGQILRGASKAGYQPEADDRVTTFVRVLRLVGLGAMVVSVVGPVMAAVGYEQAGSAMVYPTVLSLAVLGLVMALQRFFADIYCLISGLGVAGRDTLVPVLTSFALLLGFIPVLALIWGARVADLTELWTAFSRGFAIGETRVSPTDFIAFVVIFSIGLLLTRLLQGTLRNNVLPKTNIDTGGRNAIVSGLGYVGIFLAALIAITGAGIDLSSLAIVAGALSVGIGFGLQNIVSNFVSGIILLIERPISEGDWIEVGGQQGIVRAISVRSTRIETFDRTDVIVPNADLVSGTVTNFTRGNTVGRVIIPVGVAYGTDTRKVEKILKEIADAHPMALATPAPFVLLSAFGADSLDFEIRMVLRDINWSISVRNDVNHAIVGKFAEHGIEIPFAQRDVWLRNPEALAGQAPPQNSAAVGPKTDPDTPAKGDA